MKRWIKKSDISIGIFLAAGLILPMMIRNTYNQHVLILALLYATLGSAWNILGGYAGQTSFGNAIFFGIGAYTSVCLYVYHGITPWIGMLAGAVLSVFVSVLVGLPCFRLKGPYFVIASIALVQIFNAFASKWELIGAARGITVPLAETGMYHFQFESKAAYYYIILIVLCITIFIVSRISSSKFGYYLRSINMNQDAAESMGINSWRYKLEAIMICAAITAIAGSFYGQYLLYLNPQNIFTLDISLQMAMVAVFGGVSTVWGPVIGAGILIPLSEYTRTYLGGSGTGINLIVYSGLLLIMALYKPFGIISIYTDWKMKREARKNAGNNS